MRLGTQVDVNLPTVGGFPQDEDIASAILADPQGLGFFGVAFAAQNQNGLNVVPLAPTGSSKFSVPLIAPTVDRLQTFFPLHSSGINLPLLSPFPPPPSTFPAATGAFVDPISGDINTYVLSRPLFAYYDASPDAFNKQRNEFLCFLVSPQGQEIVGRVGYSGISSEQITAAQAKLFCEGDATI